MQTNFTEDQLRDPGTAAANQVLRSCVHCGLCTATSRPSSCWATNSTVRAAVFT